MSVLKEFFSKKYENVFSKKKIQATENVPTLTKSQRRRQVRESKKHDMIEKAAKLSTNVQSSDPF